MGQSKARSDNFERVADCLYRYVPNGRYYAFIRKNGKLTKRSLKTTNLAEAKRVLRDERDKLDRIDAGAGRITLASLCDEYLATLSQAPKTMEQKEQIVRRIKTDWPHPSKAECQVRQVKPADVGRWLASYDFGSCTYNAHLWLIRSVFDHAVLNRQLAENPASHLKAKKREEPLRKSPTFKQFQDIVQSIRSQQFNARADESANFVEFMGLAGVGNAELRNLTWGDIDFEQGKITLFRQKTKKGYQIPIFPQLLALLETMRQPDGNSHDEKVFAICDAKKSISAACERLSLPHFDHRSLRRMFVTRALQRGVDVKTVSLWQGHTDGGRLILKVYSDVIDSHSMKMAKLMTAEEVT